MIDLTLLPRTVLWCFVSSKPSFQSQSPKGQSYVRVFFFFSGKRSTKSVHHQSRWCSFSSSSSSSSRGWYGCCLLLRSSTPTETRLLFFCCCCCCCEGVDRARIIVVIVIIFFAVYCVVVVLGGQSLFKDVSARNTSDVKNVTTIFELVNLVRKNVPQNARHNTIRPYSKERKKEKEMAGDSAKKIVQRNGRKLKFLRGLVFSSFLQHALVRIAYSRYYLNGDIIIRCDVAHVVLERRELRVQKLAKHARPTRDPHTKEMIDPGHDLSEPGVTQYYFDTIYVTCASMWLSSFWSDRFWYVTWVISAHGARHLAYGYVGPYVKNFSRNNETDERESKHEKRMRERRERRQQKSARRR